MTKKSRKNEAAQPSAPAADASAAESDTITGYDYMKYVEQAERDGKEPMSFEAWSEEASDGR